MPWTMGGGWIGIVAAIGAATIQSTVGVVRKAFAVFFEAKGFAALASVLVDACLQ